MSFETWMDYINYLLFVRHGFEIKDLPDEPFMDYYDDGMTHDEVVDIMVNRNIELEMYFD
jgi:hypothetical protein